MTTMTYEGCKVDVNPEGFLLDSSQWSPAVADEIAEEVGIAPLTERHWKVITFCREDAAREGQSPGLRRIAKLSGVDMKELYQ
ncbi:MAG TPA: TusE/DsrC/DsvC family sulfur relay protein, partial [Thermoanaerobaculia bacterium]|nr:TusE/DsrC/DsvC family sulfur relay protein [Thermoanaerobaculia bacterium]